MATTSARRSRTVAAAVSEGTSGFTRESTTEIPAALRQLPAAVFALYLKTKNFHWHMSGPCFCDCRLLLDEQADQIGWNEW